MGNDLWPENLPQEDVHPIFSESILRSESNLARLLGTPNLKYVQIPLHSSTQKPRNSGNNTLQIHIKPPKKMKNKTTNLVFVPSSLLFFFFFPRDLRSGRNTSAQKRAARRAPELGAELGRLRSRRPTKRSDEGNRIPLFDPKIGLNPGVPFLRVMTHPGVEPCPHVAVDQK